MSILSIYTSSLFRRRVHFTRWKLAALSSQKHKLADEFYLYTLFQRLLTNARREKQLEYAALQKAEHLHRNHLLSLKKACLAKMHSCFTTRRQRRAYLHQVTADIAAKAQVNLKKRVFNAFHTNLQMKEATRFRKNQLKGIVLARLKANWRQALDFRRIADKHSKARSL